MEKWSLVFLILTVSSGIVAFTDIANAFAEIGLILTIVFAILLAVSLTVTLTRKR